MVGMGRGCICSPPIHLPRTTMANRKSSPSGAPASAPGAPAPGAPVPGAPVPGAPLRRVKPSDAPAAPSPDAQPIAEQTPQRRPLAAMLANLQLPAAPAGRTTRESREARWQPSPELARELDSYGHGWAIAGRRTVHAPVKIESVTEPIPSPEGQSGRFWQVRYVMLSIAHASGMADGEMVSVSELAEAVSALTSIMGSDHKFLESFDGCPTSVLGQLARSTNRYVVRVKDNVYLSQAKAG